MFSTRGDESMTPASLASFDIILGSGLFFFLNTAATSLRRERRYFDITYQIRERNRHEVQENNFFTASLTDWPK
jgi:hypothetical protein